MIKRIIYLALCFALLGASGSSVFAQTCGGGPVYYGNKIKNCSPANCTPGSVGCNCTTSCPIGHGGQITELCGDYSGNCTACASLNNEKSSWECASGSCVWGGVTAACNLCYTGWVNTSCGGGSCASTSMQQRNVASGISGVCSTLYRCSANHPACVPPTPTDPKPTATPTPVNNPVGFHDLSDCTQTVGWTCDADDYNAALTVHFYEGATFLGSTVASVGREPGVAAACGGNANHGFTFTTPVGLKDGVAHSITAYAINIGTGTGNPALGGSPRSITCAAPTPTPTGAPVTPFFKVKNTSFYKYGNLALTYPTTLTAFDADDTTSSAFNQGGNGGVTLAQGTISLTNSTITSPDWRRENVSSGTFNASSFVAYVKSKKTYTAINTNLNGVTTANTTYLYTGDLTLTQSSFPTSTIPSGTVLLVEGNVTVGAVGQTTLNTTANTPFALIVTGTLTFADATTEVNGLYAASSVNFGAGSVPLKIVGNVVSGSSSAISRVRTSAPFNAPSLFVVFDPTHYVNLIDRISVVKSDYQQVQ